MNPVTFFFMFVALVLLILGGMGFCLASLWDGKFADAATAFVVVFATSAVFGELIRQEKKYV